MSADPKVDAVEALMREAGALPDGARVTALDQLPGGWSRHSYRAFVEGGEDEQYIVRVRPPGALLDTDLELEYRVFEALDGTAVPAPRVHGLRLGEDNPFEGPFFVMEHRTGRAPNMYGREDQAWLAEEFSGERRVATQMVETLAAIHRLDPTGLPAAIPRLSYLDVVDALAPGLRGAPPGARPRARGGVRLAARAGAGGGA